MSQLDRQAAQEWIRTAKSMSLPVDVILFWLAERMVEHMAAIDDLRTAITDLQGSVTAENAQLTQMASDLQAAHDQLTQLQGQVASGAGVSEQDLESLAQQVASVAQSAADAVASSSSSPVNPQGAPVAAPDPSAGGASPDPTAAPDPTSAPVGAPTDPTTPADPAAPADPTAAPVADPTSPDPTAAPADPTAAPSDPAAPVAAGPATSPGTGQTLYTFDLDPSTVDQTIWPPADVETIDGRPLFTYSGDANPGDANGDGVAGAWHVYTGDTQPLGGGTAAAGAEG